MAIAIPRKQDAANVITIFRVVVALFAAPWLVLSTSTAAWLLLVVIALSDKADGFVARHFSGTSDFGKRFDPFADKLVFYPYMLGLLWLMASRDVNPALIAALGLTLTLLPMDVSSTKMYFNRTQAAVTGSNSYGQYKTVFCLGALIGGYGSFVLLDHPMSFVGAISVVTLAGACICARTSLRLKRQSA